MRGLLFLRSRDQDRESKRETSSGVSRIVFGGVGMTDKVAETKRTDETRRIQVRMMMPAGCRAYMRRTLAREFPEIVKGFVEAAKAGSCPHVKLATELLKPLRKGPVESRKKGPVARVFEKLAREKAEAEARKG
jgi:hypothetical protein